MDFFSAIEKVLNIFKSRLLQITEPIKHKKSKLKLQQEFMNEIIADEKDINDEIFWNSFVSESIAFSKRFT